MTPESREKLNRGLNKYGMLEPILANRKTKHVLGGHQRLLWLDEQHPDQDYEIQVSWCNIPKDEEANVLVLLNQTNAQGSWDSQLLEKLLYEHSLDAELAGFEAEDLSSLIPDINLADFFESYKLDDPTEPPAGPTTNPISPPGDQTGQLRSQFQILITCESEEQQANLLEKFIDEGLTCRSLIS